MNNTPFSYRNQKGNTELWDAFRKKWILVTPEEEVRQFIAWYLHRDLGYPKSWIAMERNIKHQNKIYRFDLVLYNNAAPFLLIECKAPQVKIDQSVFDQIFKYNLILNIPYLMVCNGIDNRAFKIEGGIPKAIAAIPPYVSEL